MARPFAAVPGICRRVAMADCRHPHRFRSGGALRGGWHLFAASGDQQKGQQQNGFIGRFSGKSGRPFALFNPLGGQRKNAVPGMGDMTGGIGAQRAWLNPMGPANAGGGVRLMTGKSAS